MKHSEQLNELTAALSAAQAEMPTVAMDAVNPHFRNKYASLGAIITAARPVLAAHGLSVAQFPVSGALAVGVETVLMHSSGQWVSNEVSVPLEAVQGRNIAQLAGTDITYLRRYSFAAVLGIVSDEDADGEHGHAPSPQSAPAARQAPARTPAANRAAPPQRQAAQEKPREPGDNVAFGVVEQTSAKPGVSKTGKAFTKHGVKVDGVWYNHFSDTLHTAADELRGQEARLTYNIGDYGNTLCTIEEVGEQPAPQPAPEPNDDFDPFEDC